HEKLEIAKVHLIPKVLRENGLDSLGLQLSDEAILKIGREYTSEAGLRNLEREIANVLRRTAMAVAEDKNPPLVIGPERVRELLGPERFENETAAALDNPGAAIGLAWTPVGGEVLTVEATAMLGSKGVTLPGQRGQV